MSAAAGMPWAPLWDVWIVAAAATAVYINSLGHGFCYDDIRAIEMNPDLRPEERSIQELFFNDFWGTPLILGWSHKSYRPLTVLTYRLTYLLGGLDPWYYHAGNIAAYALACAAWWWVAAHAVPLGRAGRFLAGLAFAVHPMHAENVASVVGRADTLSAVAYAVCIAAYVRGGVRGSWVWMCGAWCAGAAGMLCKEHGLLGVCAGAACDLCGRGRLLRVSEWRWETTGRAAVRAGASACFVAGALAWGVWMRGGVAEPSFSRAENPMAYEETLAGRWAWWSEVHFWYAVQLVYPRWSCIDWGYNVIPRPSVPWRGLATYLLVLGIPLLLLRTRHRERAVVCCALTVVPFLPSSGLLRVGTTLAERLLLLPSMGFTLALGVVFEWAAGVGGGGTLGDESSGDADAAGEETERNANSTRNIGGMRRRKGSGKPAVQQQSQRALQPEKEEAEGEVPPTPAVTLRGAVLWAVFLGMLGVWGYWAVASSARWVNNVTLYESQTQTCTESVRGYWLYAKKANRRGGDPEGVKKLAALERGMRILKWGPLAGDLGIAYRGMGRKADALPLLQVAVKESNVEPYTQHALANLLYHDLGRRDEGIAAFKRLMLMVEHPHIRTPKAANYIGDYADILAVEYQLSNKDADAAAAIKYYRRASLLPDGSVHNAFPCQWALNWVVLALNTRRAAEADPAVAYAVRGCADGLAKVFLMSTKGARGFVKAYGHVPGAKELVRARVPALGQ